MTRWRKSTYSSGTNGCWEFAELGDGTIGFRDSKLGDASPVLRLTRGALRDLLDRANTGEFDDLV